MSYQFSGTGVQASLPVPSGTHWLVVQESNASGATYKAGIAVNVAQVPNTITAPAPNATLNSPITITASAPASSPVETNAALPG